MNKYAKETTYEEIHERYFRKPVKIVKRNFNVKNKL